MKLLHILMIMCSFGIVLSTNLFSGGYGGYVGGIEFGEGGVEVEHLTKLIDQLNDLVTAARKVASDRAKLQSALTGLKNISTGNDSIDGYFKKLGSDFDELEEVQVSQELSGDISAIVNNLENFIKQAGKFPNKQDALDALSNLKTLIDQATK